MFKHISHKNNQFKFKPAWHALFSQHNVFQSLQTFPSHAQRGKFDEFVLKVALEKDLDFMTQLVVDRAVITPQLISVLANDNQQRMIIDLLSKPIRPSFIS